MKISRGLTLLMMMTMSLVVSGCAGNQGSKILTLGYQDYRANNYPAASAAATKFILQNPESIRQDEAYYLRAISREARGNLSGARADYRQAIAHSHRADLLGKSYKALGDMAFVKNHFSIARISYMQSLRSDPSASPGPSLLYRLATCLQNNGHWNQAHTYYEQLVGLYPSDPMSNIAMGRMAMTHFALQYGAYIYSSAAWNAARILQSHGIAAVVLVQLTRGRRLFVVQSGQYPTFASAMAARQIAAMKSPQVIVTP